MAAYATYPSPSSLIEFERRRLLWLCPEEDSPFEDDCPCCQALANESLAPGFWHLDGCNMDSGFAFSFFRTEGEWEEEVGCMEENSQDSEQKDEGEGGSASIQ
jgi:hypothetical protein